MYIFISDKFSLALGTQIFSYGDVFEDVGDLNIGFKSQRAEFDGVMILDLDNEEGVTYLQENELSPFIKGKLIEAGFDFSLIDGEKKEDDEDEDVLPRNKYVKSLLEKNPNENGDDDINEDGNKKDKDDEKDGSTDGDVDKVDEVPKKKKKSMSKKTSDKKSTTKKSTSKK